MSQFDLFGAPAVAEARRPSVPLPRHTEAPTPAPTPTLPDPFPVPDHWMHRLSRAGYPEPIIVVSALYTEVVLEVLATKTGQFLLHRDGLVTEAPAADWPPRRRFLTAAEAKALHRTHPLVVTEWPMPQTVHLRLARPGDAWLPDLPLPPFHEH